MTRSLESGAPLQRRAFLRRSCALCAAGGWLAGAPPTQAQPAPSSAPTGIPPEARFARPALDTDEGGLWAMMDREETRLRRSQFVVRDAALTRYLSDMVARLAGDHAADIRVHVVRTPLFNANMAPNGMMQVWTGLLLRVENEAQLAAIVGHELGHYFERHTVERLRDMKNRAAFAQFIAMFGLVGAVGQLGVLAGAFSFSREQESQADEFGMRLMRRAGYDGREAARVWDNLMGELAVTGGQDVGRRSPMMASHPPVLDRRDRLLRQAGDAGGEVGAQALAQVFAPHRAGWLQDEVRRGQYEESLVLLDRLLGHNPDDVQVLLARAEVRRMRGSADDFVAALKDLQRLEAMPEPPADTYRTLGIMLRQRSDAGGAATAFEKYLAASPEAHDAALIKSYLLELKP